MTMVTGYDTFPRDGLHFYYVTGYGVFPFDLLRRSQAWPRLPTDAAKLGRFDKQRSIQLASRSLPDEAAWRAADWPVGSDLIT